MARRRGSKVINSFVSKSSHKGRYPGFAKSTFPGAHARPKRRNKRT